MPLLLISAITGCESRNSPPSVLAGSLACRIVATRIDDPVFAAAAQIGEQSAVMRDGTIVGKWFPIADQSLAAEDVGAIPNAMLRKSETGLEILVAISDDDITDADAAGVITGAVDTNNRPAITVMLTDNGSNRFFKLTVDNSGRYLAIIVGGEVRSVPKIQSPINEQFIVVSPSAAESTKLSTILTGH